MVSDNWSPTCTPLGSPSCFPTPYFLSLLKTTCVPRTGYRGKRSAISLTKAASAWMDLRRFILQDRKHGYKRVILRSMFALAWVHGKRERERESVCVRMANTLQVSLCLVFLLSTRGTKQNNVQALCFSPHVVSVAGMTRDLCGIMDGRHCSDQRQTVN